MLSNLTPYAILEDLHSAWRGYHVLEQELEQHMDTTNRAVERVRQAESNMQLQMDRIQDLLETGERIMNGVSRAK